MSRRLARGLPIAVGLTIAVAMGACGSSGPGGPDAAPDLALPPQVSHVGMAAPVCCVETTPSNWRVMYLANPKPGGSDAQGNDIATQGDLHIADAYGADQVLASKVPRNAYVFTPDGQFIMYLAPSGIKSDTTYALMLAPLSADTLGLITPITVIPSGLDNHPFSDQSFFSPSGRYFVIGVNTTGALYSADLTVVEVATGRVIGALPNGAFDYLENVTFSDIMVYQNSTASKTPGVASVEGLYAQPLALVGAGKPALIDTRPVSFTITADQQKVVYTRYDGSMWLYDLADQSHVLLESGVVNFSVGGASSGPLVWAAQDLSLHVSPILQPETVKTAPGTTTPFSSFVFSPSQQDLYFFNRTSTLGAQGDLYRLDLHPGQISGKPSLIDHAVSQSDFTFIGGRLRYLRNLDSRGDVGELVSANLDGSDQRSIAFGVPTGSLQSATPQPVMAISPPGNPPRGPIDMATPVIPPVYAHLVNAARDTSFTTPLFDDSQPIVGALAFSREEESIQLLDPSVHVGGFQFSPDGYVLVYAGGATLNTQLAAYLGTLRLYQTLIDQDPVAPMLSGVSEVSPIRDRAFFAAAPGASPPGVYFIRY